MLDMQFFYENAGFSYDPKTETSEQGRIRCAYELACAEVIAEDRGYIFEWSVDPDINSSDFRDDCEPYALWQCVMLNDMGIDVLASLHGIDFGPDNSPDDDDYSRVIQAELASEMI